MGVAVAGFTGFSRAFATGAVVPDMTMKAALWVLVLNVMVDLHLYMVRHPVDGVAFDR